jgi:hypothetical protein
MPENLFWSEFFFISPSSVDMWSMHADKNGLPCANDGHHWGASILVSLCVSHIFVCVERIYVCPVDQKEVSEWEMREINVCMELMVGRGN